jgi:hypothetical protein
VFSSVHVAAEVCLLVVCRRFASNVYFYAERVEITQLSIGVSPRDPPSASIITSPTWLLDAAANCEWAPNGRQRRAQADASPPCATVTDPYERRIQELVSFAPFISGNVITLNIISAISKNRY